MSLDSLKTFSVIGGTEVVYHLPSSSEIEAAIKVIIQIVMFVWWLADRKKTQSKKEDT